MSVARTLLTSPLLLMVSVFGVLISYVHISSPNSASELTILGFGHSDLPPNFAPSRPLSRAPSRRHNRHLPNILRLSRLATPLLPPRTRALRSLRTDRPQHALHQYRHRSENHLRIPRQCPQIRLLHSFSCEQEDGQCAQQY